MTRGYMQSNIRTRFLPLCFFGCTTASVCIWPFVYWGQLWGQKLLWKLYKEELSQRKGGTISIATTITQRFLHIVVISQWTVNPNWYEVIVTTVWIKLCWITLLSFDRFLKLVQWERIPSNCIIFFIGLRALQRQALKKRNWKTSQNKIRPTTTNQIKTKLSQQL